MVKSGGIVHRIFLYAILVATMGIFCSREYNPFLDRSNSSVIVKYSTFQSGDTVNIFDKDTIQIAIAVAENVDSVTLHNSKNLYFSDTCIIAQTSKLYSFPISFFDTGWQDIDIFMFRSSGEKVKSKFHVYVRYSLKQRDIKGQYDKPVSLSTESVGVSDVLYHWDFGRGTVINSPFSDTTVIIHDARSNDTGYLWVSDVKGTKKSPKIPFKFVFSDDVGPSIICVNEGFVNNDTIITGTASLSLMFSITDRGLSTVYNAVVNDTSFDLSENGVYVKFLDNLDTITGYKPITVTAVDNAYFQNSSTKTFYVKYDPTIKLHDNGIYLSILTPPGDSLVFSKRERSLYGKIQNYTNDSVNLSLEFTVNDSVYSDRMKLSASDRIIPWDRVIMLNKNVNKVKISLYKDSLLVLDTGMTFFFDKDKVDTLPPVIIGASSNGTNLNRLYTTHHEIPVKVVVFDEGSGVASVKINTTELKALDSSKYIWKNTIPITHSTSGTNLIITATDNNGFSKSIKVSVFYNNIPYIKRTPNPPIPIFWGSTYKDTITVVDDDIDDIVQVLKKSAPDGFNVDRIGNISWKPKESDIGLHTIKLEYSDGAIPEPLTYTYNIIVKDSSGFINPKFYNTEQDFPKVLGVGDTMSVPIGSLAGYGEPPYMFSIESSDITPPWLEGSTVKWIPEISDTGYKKITIILTDKLEKCDTLIPIIHVVKADNPCSLLVSYNIRKTEDGALDLTESTSPETLLFSINDEDLPQIESHKINVDFSGSAIIGDVDKNKNFIIILNKSKNAVGYDTLTVSLSDKTGSTSTVRLRIFYGWLKKTIRINTGISGANIPTNLFGFPILIKLRDDNFDFSKSMYDGHDIRFTKFNGDSLDFEVERWDSSLKKADIWVKLDTLWGDSIQRILMFYGNKKLASESNPHGVFDTSNGFSGVWHFEEKGEILRNDATYNKNNAIAEEYGSNDWREGIAGICDSARNISSTLTIKDPANSQLNKSFTVSAWVLGYNSSSKIISKYNWDSGRKSWQFGFESTGGKYPTIVLSKNGYSSFSSRMTQLVVEDGDWNYLAFTFNYETQKITATVNGKFQVQTTQWSSNTSLYSYNTGISIRSYKSGDNVKYPLKRAIDEVRVSNVVRSVDWLRMCYENQKPNSKCLTVE